MSDGDGSAHAQRGDGRVLAGRYRLVSVVGRGGMGTVWRAQDEMLDREVAVKEVLLRHELSDAERADRHRRTLREARASARLNHPGVVTVHDVVDEDDRPWIVMELVPARSVQEILDEDGPLPPGRVAAIGRQVVGALRAAHAIGILHRDVKPANVLLTGDDRAVLTDFGIAQVAGDATLTQTGLLVGSPAYMSPERVKGERAIPASDLWALGATLYAACEGRPPHHRSEAMAVLAAVMTQEPPPPRNAGPLGSVLYGLLQRDPVDRLRAEQAEEMLGQIAAQSAAQAVAQSAAPAPNGATASWQQSQAAGGPADRTAGLMPPMPDLPTQDRGDQRASPDWPTTGTPGTPAKRRRMLLPLLAGALVAAVIVGIAAVVYWPEAKSAGGEFDAVPTPTAPTGSAPAGAGRPTKPPATAPGKDLPALPAGYKRARGPGFSIGVPDGWVRREQGLSTFWRDPRTGAYVQVDRTGWTGDPYQHWTQWAREVQAKNSLAGFRRLNQRRTWVGARPAADIEFTWSRFRAIDRGVIAGGRSFAVLVVVPTPRWNEYQPTVNNVLDAFQP
ncbi:serine/threonine-protein kinase [Actinomadura sp. 9N407]|uniref:serine/threonine-protein kinase n=1 Tax=Actinomadura sp. 9N407 TaxID=3375154 RepID=UPI00379B5137